MIATERDREDIAVARTRWIEDMAKLDPARLVFLEESGFNTKMTRPMGRCARGEPRYDAVPHGHWGNNTFIAGLRADRIDAPMLLQGAMNSEVFAAWSEQ